MYKNDENVSENNLTDENKLRLEEQNSRLVSNFKAIEYENNAQKYWDLFYKRNETRFFKDRHWCIREFTELYNNSSETPRAILEIGCGVGNFIFPLIEENLNFFIYACDLSPRAINLVKSNELYNNEKMEVFQCDITTNEIFNKIKLNSIDIVTLVFVLSSIHPDKFNSVLKKIYQLMKPGGIVLFRDYGLYDMAQFRFKAGHKISENFYVRQDGTRSYYFSTEFTKDLFKSNDFNIIENTYIHRRTKNIKENIDVPRIFIQLKAIKPA